MTGQCYICGEDSVGEVEGQKYCSRHWPGNKDEDVVLPQQIAVFDVTVKMRIVGTCWDAHKVIGEFKGEKKVYGVYYFYVKQTKIPVPENYPLEKYAGVEP